MNIHDERIRQIDAILSEIIEHWYERVKENYVTAADSQMLGIAPELKRFHEPGHHRIKFSRKDELDVTYGLCVGLEDGKVVIESSVNNKSKGFDYDAFVARLESYYWSSCTEKPWTDPDFDRFAYGDLLQFDPRMGHAVSLDVREEKADIIRLSFEINPRHERLLMERRDVLRDLVENFCLAPLKRIYAESYREQ